MWAFRASRALYEAAGSGCTEFRAEGLREAQV